MAGPEGDPGEVLHRGSMPPDVWVRFTSLAISLGAELRLDTVGGGVAEAEAERSAVITATFEEFTAFVRDDQIARGIDTNSNVAAARYWRGLMSMYELARAGRPPTSLSKVPFTVRFLTENPGSKDLARYDDLDVFSLKRYVSALDDHLGGATDRMRQVRLMSELPKGLGEQAVATWRSFADAKLPESDSAS